MKKSRSERIKKITQFSLFLIVVVAGIFMILSKRTHFDYALMSPGKIKEYLSLHPKSAPAVFVLICTAKSVLWPVPMGLSVVAGLVFGLSRGIFYIMLSGILGSIIGFFYTRFIASSVIRNRLKGRLLQFDRWLASGGWPIVFSLRIIIPWEIFSLLAGVSRISIRDYFIGTLLSVAPISFISVFFGNSLTHVFSLQFVFALLLLISFYLFSHKYRAWLLQKTEKDEADVIR
ncbi:MAG: TVP38/TMEM64 family protein [bacterium]